MVGVMCVAAEVMAVCASEVPGRADVVLHFNRDDTVSEATIVVAAGLLSSKLQVGAKVCVTIEVQ